MAAMARILNFVQMNKQDSHTASPKADTCESKERIAELEMECTNLRSKAWEKDAIIERLRNDKAALEKINKKQVAELFSTIIKLASVTEAHQQAVRQLKKTVKGSIKHFIWRRNTKLLVRVTEAEKKLQLRERELATANQALEKIKAELNAEKDKTDKQVSRTKYRLWEAEKKLVKTSEKYNVAQKQIKATFTGTVRSFIGQKLGLDQTDAAIFERERLRIEKERLGHEQECLLRERRVQAKIIARGEEKCCAVCLDDENDVDITFLPCGHNICCKKCSAQLKSCPACRQSISKSIKTFH